MFLDYIHTPGPNSFLQDKTQFEQKGIQINPILLLFQLIK